MYNVRENSLSNRNKRNHLLNRYPKYNTANKNYSKTEKDAVSPIIKISLFTTDKMLMD